MQGFKSFADKVIIELEQGITAVVGPNGSGKSNISDAIRWVLGEQSIKTLRGSKMEDVIFSGTEHRKPLNFAEVSLILDNSSKILPIDYTEVSITRRIFRSGDSEYYINKTSCRLKDIHELFMDTGLGRDGYSIIGQGRIDEILSSKSEDRRNIFEEASGIMKYKSRKNESERKLEATKQNLLRINDIIVELEYQLEPLKEQSDKAKKYLELAENLKILDINLFIENYNKLKDKLEGVSKQYSEIEETFMSYNQKMEETDQSYNVFIEQNKELENDILSINQKIFELEKAAEKVNSEINLANQKIINCDANKDRIQKEINTLQEKKLLLDEDLKKRNEKKVELDNIVAEVNNSISDKEIKLAEANKLLEESINQIEDLKSDIIEKHNNISGKKSQINSINVLVDNFSNRKQQVSSEVLELKVECSTKEEHRTNLEKSIADLKKQISDMRKSINESFNKKEAIEKELNNNTSEMDRLKGLINSKTSRYSLLCDLDKEYEGFNKSVKSILQECKKSATLSSGVHGALVQLINVSKKFEVAIDVALGGALQNIVTDDEKSAQKIIEFLKKNGLGRATFLPLTSVKPKNFEGLEAQLTGLEGFIGIASNLVQYDKKYSNIISNLLGKVLVIDNMKNGISAAKKYNYTFKIVTLEGEVLNPGGSIAGGSQNRTTSLLSRSREIEELSNEVKQLTKQLDDVTEKNGNYNNMLKQVLIEIEEAENTKREKELSLVASETELEQCKNHIERIVERLNVLELEDKQLSEQQEHALREIELLNGEINELMNQIEEISQKTTLNQDKYKNDIAARDELYDSLTQDKINASGISQELVSVNENIERITEEINSIIGQTQDSNGLIKIEESSIKEQEQIIIEKKKQLEEYELVKDGCVTELNNKTGQKSEMDIQVQNLQKMWKEYNSALNVISDEKSKLQVKIAKYEMEIESLQNRIWEEYELTYSKCLEYKKDISGFGNPNKAINDIKAQISSLGTINVSAIEDYIRVKERFEFLSKQRFDLEEAEKVLRKVINEMVQIMKKQFAEQFEIINNNFNEVFKELFGGGRAHLKLMDSENVLECGIEIEAQPPGKKLQSLMLLSGGERALTAIAILFAILKVRPTPFCVCDEIEAALDDVNVFRFAEYIKKFADRTQFLVITHRKGTMEVADSIYGVTMQEHGVSRLVSVKLSEQAS